MMIKIEVYSDGFIINGHAHPYICELVSLLGWHTTELFRRLDYATEHYTSGSDIEDNQMIGISFLKCPENDLTALFLDEFVETVKVYIISKYSESVQIKDKRNRPFSVEGTKGYFKPTKDYYNQCLID